MASNHDHGWACDQCTFHNPAHAAACEMCETPSSDPAALPGNNILARGQPPQAPPRPAPRPSADKNGTMKGVKFGPATDQPPLPPPPYTRAAVVRVGDMPPAPSATAAYAPSHHGQPSSPTVLPATTPPVPVTVLAMGVWSAEEVARFILNDVGATDSFQSLAQKIRDNNVEGEDFRDLDDQTLGEFGANKFTRTKVLRVRNAWLQQHGSSDTTVPATTSVSSTTGSSGRIRPVATGGTSPAMLQRTAAKPAAEAAEADKSGTPSRPLPCHTIPS